VFDHLGDPKVRIIESNEDPLVYPSGHIPGAAEVDWVRDLNDPIRRDYLDQAGFERLASRLGLSPDDHLVFYGDRYNWWATYALWVFSLFGHEHLSIMDGGRQKWVNEKRPMAREVPVWPPTQYQSKPRDDRSDRAFRQDVLDHLDAQGKLVDVRSPQEFSGERLHMEDYPNEGALRGGHIPTAANVPWTQAVDPATGEFLPPDALARLYKGAAGLGPQDDIIVYCRIGERSSHTWFALKHLLGYERVRNYDGSWTEWGNSVGLPIERP
jgi:thiosulfate/3-mercaptopyruvate sulfurtransferase